MPNLSAVILTYSHPENVEQIVPILRAQGVTDIVVADDGLEGVDRATLDGFDVKRYHRERTTPHGESTCRNAGARLTAGEYILFLDDDIIPGPDLVRSHVEALARFDVSIGLYCKEWDNLRTDGRIGLFESEQAPLSYMCYSGNLAIRREAFWNVGGFDDATFDGDYAWEDSDLGVRLARAGSTMTLNYSAVARHLGIAPEDADPARSAVNQAKFMAKRNAAKKIFLVYSGHMVSTFDVGRGWERALRLQGHDVLPFNYHDRIQFYNVAGQAWQQYSGKVMSIPNLVRMASEGAIAEAIEYVPDVIVIISGLVLDRILFTVFKALSLPTALILTESPYSDQNQIRLIRDVDVCFTNDRSSLERLRVVNPQTFYLPHSYDPWVHYPRAVGAEYQHDLFFFGTLYPERKAMLERVRWAGIDASISGTEISKSGDVTVKRKTRHGLRTWQPNTELAKHYAGSKISLSWHRTTADYFAGTVIGHDAYSLGPRAFEIPAGGGFMLSDASRPELREVYGDSVPTFDDAQGMMKQARYWLAHDEERRARAQRQREAVAPCSFRARAEAIFWPEVERCISLVKT